MEAEENISLIADVVGQYHGKTIAIIVGNQLINSSPLVSPDIDYLIEFPPADKSFVKTAMESLADAKFAPVLARREELGTIEPFQPIRASFQLRSTSRGECEIDDEAGISQRTFRLERRSDHIFVLPENSGLGLGEGNYSIVCSFSNEKNLTVDDLPAAHFSISKYDFPKYKGGLKETTCSLGTKKKLKAQFSPKDNKLDIHYYRDGQVMDSNIFKCDMVGTYIVQAIATDNNGVTAESPEVKMQVIDVPEGLLDAEKTEYGESY